MQVDFANLRVDFVSLKTFLVVADTENIREASEQLHLSISAVSRRITELEEDFGQPFFKRHSRGLEITPAGRLFADRVRETFASLKSLRDEMDRLKTGDVGRIAISSNGSALVNGLTRHMSLFLEEFPNVDIDLYERLTPNVFDDIRKGIADIGFIAHTLTIPEGLQTRSYLEDRLVLAVPRGHDLFNCTEVSFKRLLNYQVIGIDESSSLTRLVREVGALTNEHFSYRYMASTNEIARNLVANSLGVAIMPEAFVKPYQQLLDIAAVPIAEDWASRKISMVYRDPEKFSATAEVFLQWILDRSTNDP